MSTLRHPHIVQFLGVCFLPGSRLPALVMELLLTSLHDLHEGMAVWEYGNVSMAVWQYGSMELTLHILSKPVVRLRSGPASDEWREQGVGGAGGVASSTTSDPSSL